VPTRALSRSLAIADSATFRLTVDFFDESGEFGSDVSGSGSGLLFGALGAVVVGLLVVVVFLLWRRRRTPGSLDAGNEVELGMTWDGDFDCMFSATRTFEAGGLASHFSAIQTGDADDEIFTRFE
jgi:hypothetical protein